MGDYVHAGHCCTCTYFKMQNEGKVPHYKDGWCHMNPPVIFEASGYSSWPEVYLEEWCGQYVGRNPMRVKRIAP